MSALGRHHAKKVATHSPIDLDQHGSSLIRISDLRALSVVLEQQ